ncbi:hypothetical protein R3P38DRAFT_2572329, partial [Favolaschia claudopus]
VLRGTILIIKIELLFDNAYPLMTSRAGYARERMTQAAIPIPDAIHILRRLGVDPVFGAQLSSIPIDRTNILRGNFKRTAVTCVPAFFSLAGLSPEQVKARVEELLKDHRYIFPAIEGRLRLDQPFAQGAIAFIIKEEVFSSPLFVTQNPDRFPARSSKHPMQRELPDSMVALAATAVRNFFYVQCCCRTHNLPRFTQLSLSTATPADVKTFHSVRTPTNPPTATIWILFR